MIINVVVIALSLLALIWGADRFVDGAAKVAAHFGMPPLLIGMVIVGFGTSMPELLVSSLSSIQGNPGIALGNAYGSNITNIALILGITALINPIVVQSQVLKNELPILTLVSLLAGYQVYDGMISRIDALVLMGVFIGLMTWTTWQGVKNKDDSLGVSVEEQPEGNMTIKQAYLWLVVGLGILLISSRLLVWGAVEIAHYFQVDDLIIGLTIVAVGTSLPELASSVAAARKGEHDLALGNILGSNLFNTLAVIGIAGLISPIPVEPVVFNRDITTMIGLTVVLFILGAGWGKGKTGSINRYEGTFLLLCYVAYNIYLIM